FADPAVFDTVGYSQKEVIPGDIITTKPISSNKQIKDSFFETKTSTLSSEVMPFLQQIQTFGQLISGALPSLFGGAVNQQSGITASEYSMSRAQALQRQQNTWKMLIGWWKRSNSKAILQYIKILKEQGDERDVQKDPRNGGFVNIVIKQADLEGKIGKV